MRGLDILEILKLGGIGLGFLLALLSFNLLTREQKNPVERPKMLRAINSFMLFSVLIIVICFGAELLKPTPLFNFDSYVDNERLKYYNRAEPTTHYQSFVQNQETKGASTSVRNNSCVYVLIVSAPGTRLKLTKRILSGDSSNIKSYSRVSKENVLVVRFCNVSRDSTATPVRVNVGAKMIVGSGLTRIEFLSYPRK